jgi:hypothetical protein
MPASPGYCRWNGRFGQESLQAKQSLTRLHVAHEIHYWAYFVEYFSPWKDIASSEEEVEGKSVVLDGMLAELLIEDKEIVYVPETFQVPPQLIARVECEQMVARLDSIVFMAIPKHASYYVQTVELPLTMLEAATVTSTSPTKA